MIPPPPVDADGDLTVFSYDITAALRRDGLVGGCCVCQQSAVSWWDLAVCDVAPVTDARGQLTDAVALHERCVLGVLEHWMMLLHGDPDEDEADTPSSGPSPSSPPTDTRRSPRGAYARRTGG